MVGAPAQRGLFTVRFARGERWSKPAFYLHGDAAFGRLANHKFGGALAGAWEDAVVDVAAAA